jgi:hypothetical protein
MQTPLPLACTQLPQALFHLLKTTNFALVYRLVESMTMENLHRQHYVRPHCPGKRISEGLLELPHLVHGRALFFREYPIGNSMQCGIHLTARGATWANLVRADLWSTSKFQFKTDLSLFSIRDQVLWPYFPANLVTLNEIR